MPFQFLFELLDLLIGQRQNIGLVDRAELNVANPARFQDRDLLARIGGNLVSEGGKNEHGRPLVEKVWITRTSIQEKLWTWQGVLTTH